MILPIPQHLPIGKIIGRPYKGKIADFNEQEYSVYRLSGLIHEINPDYLLFHPSINSIQNVFLLASYASAWLFGQSFFIALVVFHDIIFYKGIDLLFLIGIAVQLLLLLMLGFAPFLTLKQLRTKKSRYYKILLLKSTQQIAYYEHNKKQEPIFHLIDYQNIIASVRGNEGTKFESLNLHIVDKTTDELIHSIKFDDHRLNPYDQWAFIRTYMERPADELPLDIEYAQECPTDMSTSLLACADIVQVSKDVYYSNANHDINLMGWSRACIVSYLDLAEGNIYQSSANPALHPEVQRRLKWDGKNNPYNMLPVTAERQAAFDNKNIKVKLKWYSGIAVNATWFIGSILYVMLVIA